MKVAGTQYVGLGRYDFDQVTQRSAIGGSIAQIVNGDLKPRKSGGEDEFRPVLS